MLGIKPSHQVVKTSLDFISATTRMLRWTLPPLPDPPMVPQVLRVAICGHLNVEHEASVSMCFEQVLSSLKAYLDSTNAAFHSRLFGKADAVPDAELRVITRLAEGFDQLAAATALDAGYELNLVLPGSRTEFEAHIARGSGASSTATDPVENFRRMAARATHTLELDRGASDSFTGQLGGEDYKQAALVLLSHCDIIIVAVSERAGGTRGGTRWTQNLAEARDLPVIVIPTAHPSEATLSWTVNGRRVQSALFDSNQTGIDPRYFSGALDELMLGNPFDRKEIEMGRVARRFVRPFSIAFNLAYWSERWNLPGNRSAEAAMGSVPDQIDNAFKCAKAWADLQASAMAVLVRGAFIAASASGIAAIVWAFLCFVVHGESVEFLGKTLEVLSFAVILALVGMSHHYNWRGHWLGMRHLERSLDQAAWLAISGHGSAIQPRIFNSQFEASAIANWCDFYLRAVVRASSVPSIVMTSNYRIAVHELVLANLVENQVAYYEREIKFQEDSDRFLKRWIVRFCWIAFVGAFVYLALLLVSLSPTLSALLVPGFVCPGCVLKSWLQQSKIYPAAAGILLPAVIAAFSAIRSHGEYAQMAARYADAVAALKVVGRRLASRLPDIRRHARAAMSSDELAAEIAAATGILRGEVINWRAVQDKKSIEPG